MPYIPQEDRCELLETHRPETTGQLNYLLTTVISNYYDRRQTYAAINDVLGALEGAARKGYAARVRPAKQGGLWYVAEEMKILEPA